jgi:hypothetical protein
VLESRLLGAAQSEAPGQARGISELRPRCRNEKGSIIQYKQRSRIVLSTKY